MNFFEIRHTYVSSDLKIYYQREISRHFNSSYFILHYTFILCKEALLESEKKNTKLNAKSNLRTNFCISLLQVVLHPGFQNQSDWNNDLALIQLKQPVVINDKVTPIPLPERGQDLAKAVHGSGIITGWGWGPLLTPSPFLKHIVVPLANHSECRAEYESLALTPTVDDDMICTAATKYQENVCFGDAGGALAVTDPETGDIYAAGILSYDKSCTRYKHAVYMKLSSYLPWIHSIMRGDTDTSTAVRFKAMSAMYRRQE